MRQKFTPITALIFILLAAVGSASAGDCMKLCKSFFWNENTSISDIEMEIARGANIHDNVSGYTPLHFAARKSTPEIVQFLVNEGVNLEAKVQGDTTGPEGETPLHYATYSRNPENVAVLLKAGSNIDAKDGRKRTALHFAVRK